MAGGLHRAPRFDLVGHIPKRRAGGPPLKHRAFMAAMKPAAAFDEVQNNPLTRRAMARKTVTQVAGAAAHVGGMMLLAKARDGHDAFEVSKSYLGGGKFARAVELTAAQREKVARGGHYAMENGAPRALYHGTNEGAARSAAKGGLRRPSNLEQRTVQAKGDKGIWAARDTSRTGAGPYAHTAFLRNAKGAVTRKEGPAMLRVRTEGRPSATKMGGRWLEFKPGQVKDAKLMRRRTQSDGVYDRITTAPEHLEGRHAGSPGRGTGGGGARKDKYRGQ